MTIGYLGLTSAEAERLLAGPIPERLDADPYFDSQRALVIAPAAQLRLPAIYEWREFAEAGGLMSYGTSLTEAYRHNSLGFTDRRVSAKPSPE